MEKKYQVFISSTFTDLKEERMKVLEILLMADCIPAGMEAFVATDNDQFNVIKKVIDLCDFYILIIGKRYGSINEKTGLSYTEMEYDYAISQGIPVLVFAINDTIDLPDEKKETNEAYNEKLKLFKSKAMKNRLASIWNNIGDLIGKVAISIMSAKKDFDRPGWVRGIQDTSNLLLQIKELYEDKEKIQTELNNAKNEIEKLSKLDEDLAFENELVSLHFTEICYIITSNTTIHEYDKNFTLDEVFKAISVRLTAPVNNRDFLETFSTLMSGYSVNSQQALALRTHFVLLELLEIEVDKKGIELTTLSEKGKKVMGDMYAIRKKADQNK